MLVYLRTKFQVSSIILTNFREGVVSPPPTAKQTPKMPSQIEVKKWLDIIPVLVPSERFFMLKFDHLAKNLTAFPNHSTNFPQFHLY